MEKKRRIGSPAFVLVLLLIGLVVVLSRSNSSSAQGRGPAALLPAALGGPVTIRAQDGTQEIKPSQYWTWTFDVPADHPNCRMTGHIEALSGGNKDITVLVSTWDEYLNWKNDHAAKVFFSTGQETAVPLNVAMGGSGKYALVISNAFSLFSSKVVQLQGVQLTCSR